jgi:hypothetical protein
MIILDTNVLSEMVRAKPAPPVHEWLSAQPPLKVFTASITQAEMLFGVAALPSSKRRTALAKVVEEIFAIDFLGRVLHFDGAAARAYAEIAAARRRAGRPIGLLDAQIAGIARSTGHRLATRNTADFEDCGVQLFNPWKL